MHNAFNITRYKDAAGWMPHTMKSIGCYERAVRGKIL